MVLIICNHHFLQGPNGFNVFLRFVSSSLILLGGPRGLIGFSTDSCQPASRLQAETLHVVSPPGGETLLVGRVSVALPDFVILQLRQAPPCNSDYDLWERSWTGPTRQRIRWTGLQKGRFWWCFLVYWMTHLRSHTDGKQWTQSEKNHRSSLYFFSYSI